MLSFVSTVQEASRLTVSLLAVACRQQALRETLPFTLYEVETPPDCADCFAAVSSC